MEPSITLTLTASEVNVILAGLSELPAKYSVNLLAKIKTEAETQLKSKTETTE